MDHFPLTHPQKRIWYTQQMYPSSSLCNIGGGIIVEKSLNLKVLENAILHVIKKHDSMRIQIGEHDDEPYQYVLPFTSYQVNVMDFSAHSDPWKNYYHWVDTFAHQPFHLIHSRLFEICIIKVNESNSGYFLKFHHLILDGWSTDIITKEIKKYYYSFLFNEQFSEEQLPGSYFDLLSDENEYKATDRFLKDKEYWTKKFEILPDSLDIGHSNDIKGLRSDYSLDDFVCRKAREYCERQSLSIPALFSAAFCLMLARFFQKDEVVIGMPVLNRSGVNKNITGMYVSTMPLRITTPAEMTAEEYIKQVAKESKISFLHQKYPYDLLAQDLGLRQKGREGLFDVSFNYYNTSLALEYEGHSVRNEEFHNGDQIYSLQCLVKEWSLKGDISVSFDYKTSLLDKNTIDSFFDCFSTILIQLISVPGYRLRELQLLSLRRKAYYHSVFNNTFSEYPRKQTLVDLFDQQMKVSPNAVALSEGDRNFSFRELEEHIYKISTHLQELCKEKQKIVGVAGNNSAELVITILSVLKSGAVLLPIDPDYPEERIRYMLEDTGTDILLTNIKDYSLSCFNGTIVNIKDLINLPSVPAVAFEVSPDDLAYIIYTSGSTGKPKGTMVTHQNLLNYIYWAKNQYIKSKQDVFAFYSSIAFDLTMTSIFVPLISGIECRAFPKQTDEHTLYTIVRENIATVIKVTPSHLNLLRNFLHKNTSLKTFIVGGENLKSELAFDIHNQYNKAEIYNEYGPTETTVGCICHKYDPLIDQNTSVFIGKPAANVQAYVLSKDNQLMPYESVGELYISGDGVAGGYLHHAALSAQKFINDPFTAHKHMYKTGDLVKMTSSGNLLYIGRNDKQIKLSGYRIEVEEIENLLLQHPAVKQAVVVASLKEEVPVLWACLVAKMSTEIAVIKDYLSAKLPGYMIPGQIIFVDYIPVTTNGKVDIQALQNLCVVSNNEVKIVNSDEPLSQYILQAVKEVLGSDAVSLKDRFIALGGDSIKAIQVSHKLRNKQIIIHVSDILEKATIQDIVNCAKPAVQDTNLECSMNDAEMTPVIRWFFDSMQPDPHYYHQSIITKISSRYSKETLEKIFMKLVEQHDALRLNYSEENDKLIINNQFTSEDLVVHYEDLTHLPEQKQKEEISKIAVSRKAAISISRGLPLSVSLFKINDDINYLLIIVHHLAIDAVSWGVLLDDFTEHLEAKQIKCEVSPAPAVTCFTKYTTILKKHAQNLVEKETEYWMSANNVKMTDKQFVCRQSECITREINLTKEDTANLLYRCHDTCNTKNDELLKIAFAITISELHQTKDVAFIVEGHGRTGFPGLADISGTIGWLTAMYLLRLHVNFDDKLSNTILSLKEAIRSVPSGGVGFGIMQYILMKIERSSSDYLYNFVGDLDSLLRSTLLEQVNCSTGPDISPKNNFKSLAELNAYIGDQQLVMQLKFNSSKFNSLSAQFFCETFSKNIALVIDHCIICEQSYVTPSDFRSVDISQQELDTLFA